MNLAATDRLVLARAAGWGYDQLADLYDVMKQQIERSVTGWRADRARCADGSHAFIGRKGPVLIITPSRRMFIGRFASDGLLSWSECFPHQPGASFFLRQTLAQAEPRRFLDGD